MSIDDMISLIFIISVLIYVIQTSRYIGYIKKQNILLSKDIEIISKLYQEIINSKKDNKKEEQESDEE